MLYRNENGTRQMDNWSNVSSACSWQDPLFILSLVDCYTVLGHNIFHCPRVGHNSEFELAPFSNHDLECELNWPHPKGSWIQNLLQEHIDYRMIVGSLNIHLIHCSFVLCVLKVAYRVWNRGEKAIQTIHCVSKLSKQFKLIRGPKTRFISSFYVSDILVVV